MHILLVEPFYTGSHKSWADGYKASSRHEIEILSLPGRHWKWRMHGAAVTFAEICRENTKVPDVIIASDMLDLASFIALLPRSWRNIPYCIYFHENQLSYPWSKTDPDVQYQRNRHYSFINFTSALAADRVFFNSKYHLDSFLESLPDFLKGFPDYLPLTSIENIRKKSSVLHLGLDLVSLGSSNSSEFHKNEIPLVLWNHRWEYDKNPDLFFNTLFKLQDLGIDFQLAVCGKEFQSAPDIFSVAKERLANRIIHWGFLKSRAEYIQLLNRADILPVTNIQDFFGISIAEAAWCGTSILLPNRLAYSELFPFANFYTKDSDFQLKLIEVIQGENKIEQKSCFSTLKTYDWNSMSESYDSLLDSIASDFINIGR